MPAPSAAAVDQNDPLPRCKGPQTRRFHHRGKIQFQKFLGPDAKDKSPSAAHGYVFQVVINRRPFALKIVSSFSEWILPFELSLSVQVLQFCRRSRSIVRFTKEEIVR